MKKYIYTLIATLFIVSNAFSQVPYWFEELLEEKVPNKEIRELLEEAKIKYDAGQPYQQVLKKVHERAVNQQMLEKVASQTADIVDEQDLGFGAEPYITVNPNNHDHLVLSFMEQTINGSSTQLDMPIFVSFDAGDSWAESSFSVSQAITSQGLYVLGGGDPLLSFGTDSTLHLTWVYLTSNDPQGIFTAEIGLYYAHSVNGGLDFTFSTDPAINTVYKGALLQQDLIDRQWMDVDATGGTYNGNVYMSALYGGNTLAPAGQVIFVKTPGVNQFNNAPVTGVTAGASTQTQFGNVRVGDDGTVHMACMLLNPQTAIGNLMYVKSLDGGATYSSPASVAQLTTGLPANVLGQQTIPSKVHSRENAAISLATEGTNIYVAWSDMSNDDIHSYLAISNDNGATWSAPLEFGEELVGDHAYHLMPNVSADSGGLSLTWYVVNRASLLSDYYFVESTDGGSTFTDMQVISASNTNFNGMAISQEDFFGDYNASVRIGCTTYATWCDGRSGEPHTYIAKITSCNNEQAPTLSVEQIPVNANYAITQLYPNPVNGNVLSFEVSTVKEDEIAIELLDLQGRIVIARSYAVFGKGNKVVDLNMSSIADGSYLLRLVNKAGAVTTKKVQVIR